MSVVTRAYDDEHGDPVVVMVAAGTFDVSRLVGLLSSGRCEDAGTAQRVRRQVRRHAGGRAALALLRGHGGPDFTEPEPAAGVLKLLRLAVSDPGGFVAREVWPSGVPETTPGWAARAVLAALAGQGLTVAEPAPDGPAGAAGEARRLRRELAAAAAERDAALLELAGRRGEAAALAARAAQLQAQAAGHPAQLDRLAGECADWAARAGAAEADAEAAAEQRDQLAAQLQTAQAELAAARAGTT